ncbi:transposase family protein [Streptomyces sp. NBC_00648]|uniref:transposase family protein n=1 Tax=Streptomyces sp. NBC_00648 TaxID=2975797 RepID=UPI00386F9801
MDEGFVGEADERSADTVITPVKRRRMTELSDKHKASNKVHVALRAPVERTISQTRQWRVLRQARISPSGSEQAHVSRRRDPHSHDLHVKRSRSDAPAPNNRIPESTPRHHPNGRTQMAVLGLATLRSVQISVPRQVASQGGQP